MTSYLHLVLFIGNFQVGNEKKNNQVTKTSKQVNKNGNNQMKTNNLGISTKIFNDLKLSILGRILEK